ncbi:NADP-dependent oxidoreductase domain-containing protein [Glomus cerebriforme]|uniref:NADP-dependent oxidoreductase domain-containing protein n=1 Tax=Glomus cerebriforme TaxID=658196 RepID=A0A397SJL9_9GLOM|nr:NADP-dependent oxidoreductase domain-containing protein [Glomus cerebriforme]
MSLRELDKTGVKVPAIGMGTFTYSSSDEQENIKTLNRAIELGCTFWDTADAYGNGTNEILLSKILKERRDEVFLCTKFGITRGSNGKFKGISGTPEYIRQACDNSLQRLGIDYIDLYYQHHTVGALAELVKEGKVKYIGLSECSAETLRRAYKVHPIAAVQMEYSPWTLDIETNGIMEACRELGVTIVAYSPLGRGFLTGRYKSVADFEPDDFRRELPRFQGENFDKNLELVHKFKEFANKKGVTPGQLCLAWILAQGDNIVTIPGTRKIKHLEENVEAAKIQLNSDELSEIRRIINSIEIVGTRYNDLYMKGMSAYGSSDEQENINVLNRAIELGCTFWDTSDFYGVGASEILLTKVLKERRNEVFLCTKFGIVRGPNREIIGMCGTPEYVRQACDNSLKRLGTDHIDLYYQHRVDPNTPIEDTVSALAELVKEGKVRYIGLSECSAETLRRAYKVHPIAAVQMEYSPWTLDIETNGIMEACRELGVTIVACSPLGRGFLTGRFKSFDDFEPDDYRRLIPRFQEENFDKNFELVHKFNEFANKKGVTPGQLCLAWVIAQGDNIVAIPGTRKIKYLEENFDAAKIQLNFEELSEIRQIINSIEIIGTRYHQTHMKLPSTTTNLYVDIIDSSKLTST